MQNVQAWFDAENPSGTEPDEAAYAALAADIRHLKEVKAQGSVGTRVNYILPGTRSLVHLDRAGKAEQAGAALQGGD